MENAMGVRIKELRTALNLTREKFAQECKMSSSLLIKVELGTTPITKDVIEKIETRWQTPPGWIETGKGKMSFVKTDKAENAWQDITYKELKENNSYLQRKLDEVTGMLSQIISRGGNLGKSKALKLAEMFRQAA